MEVAEFVVKLHIIIDCIGTVFVAHFRIPEGFIEVVLGHLCLVSKVVAFYV